MGQQLFSWSQDIWNGSSKFLCSPHRSVPLDVAIAVTVFRSLSSRKHWFGKSTTCHLVINVSTLLLAMVQGCPSTSLVPFGAEHGPPSSTIRLKFSTNREQTMAICGQCEMWIPIRRCAVLACPAKTQSKKIVGGRPIPMRCALANIGHPLPIVKYGQAKLLRSRYDSVKKSIEWVEMPVWFFDVCGPKITKFGRQVWEWLQFPTPFFRRRYLVPIRRYSRSNRQVWNFDVFGPPKIFLGGRDPKFLTQF